MNRSNELGWLRDPRLAAHVTSALPVWLWSADATRILWANAAGAAIFGSPSLAALKERLFDLHQPAPRQVAALTASLSPGAAPRLERLGGLGAGTDRMLCCFCSRIVLADGQAAILVAATEPAGPMLPLADRVRFIFPDESGTAAFFTAEGKLIHAAREASLHLGGAATLGAICADPLRQQVLATGFASATIAGVATTLERIGSGNDIVIMVTFDGPVVPLAKDAVAAGVRAAGGDLSSGSPARDAVAAETSTQQRTFLSLARPPTNVVPFRQAGLAPSEKRTTLTPVEHTAFQEIAKALGGRVDVTDDAAERVSPGPSHPAAREIRHSLENETTGPPPDRRAAAPAAAGAPAQSRRRLPRHMIVPSAYAPDPGATARAQRSEERTILDRVPSAALVWRDHRLLYANRALFDWTGYEDLTAIELAGGIERLFVEPGISFLGETGSAVQRLAVITRRGVPVRVAARLYSIQWEGKAAFLVAMENAEAAERARAAEDALGAAHKRAGAAQLAEKLAQERVKAAEAGADAAQAAARELQSILDIAADGVAVVDREGFILNCNAGIQALLEYGSRDLLKRSFFDLIAAESQSTARDHLEGLAHRAGERAATEGCDVTGQAQSGRLVPLFMTIGRLAGGGDKYCVVLRDTSRWKHAEMELTRAKQQAEKASSAKSDFLAKVSHEIRTPLNSIIGFSEVMMEQRFGPVGNDRYRQYLGDIHASGQHLISLINDLLDLSKIEAGKLDLQFATVNLNEVIRQCVAMMQPESSRARVIMRTSLAPALPPIVADERSVRQIVLNLLSNSIKFTGAGGQVIVSSAPVDQGGAVLRVRDTGVGMTEKELTTALEPFRQVATSGRAGSGGTGLGLPLSKALAEANNATFSIKSALDAGTLVEIVFPASRAAAE